MQVLTSRSAHVGAPLRLALVAGLALLTAPLLLTPGAEAATDPNTPVASDGSATPRERATTVKGESGFRGVAGPVESEGEPLDVGAISKMRPARGRVGPESIIGTDDRVQVTSTKTYPARATVLITFKTSSGAARCSGWLYGKNIVGTAGHCVHEGPGGSFHKKVKVYPGANGSKAPYGYCKGTTLYTVVGWATSGDEEYDYGAIKLDCKIGKKTGWFGYFWQSASLDGTSTTIQGYPGDKPLTQWQSLDLVRATTTRQIFYQNDTVGGMSGSPVYANGGSGCTGPCVMAIHAYGVHGTTPHDANNHGTRITQAVFTNLLNWKNS